MSNFNKIISVNSKFDTLNNFYKEFIELLGANGKTEENEQKEVVH